MMLRLRGDISGRQSITFAVCIEHVNGSYDWGGKQYKLNHLLFMDDLK